MVARIVQVLRQIVLSADTVCVAHAFIGLMLETFAATKQGTLVSKPEQIPCFSAVVFLVHNVSFQFFWIDELLVDVLLQRIFDHLQRRKAESVSGGHDLEIKQTLINDGRRRCLKKLS